MAKPPTCSVATSASSPSSGEVSPAGTVATTHSLCAPLCVSGWPPVLVANGVTGRATACTSSAARNTVNTSALLASVCLAASRAIHLRVSGMGQGGPPGGS
jgi:hypothetical protein